jgi:DNA-binding MarR family transcriptional regulator
MKAILNTCWAKIANVETVKNSINRKLTATEFKALCFISVQPTTRSKIISSRHFKKISMSTIKRAITTLIKLDLIDVSAADDGRKKLLTIKDNV